MCNQTTVAEFLLLGFSDIQKLQILHFGVFLVIYLAALVGNVLIIAAIVLNHQLHTPMYFFLINLSILDMGFISVTIPKSMVNSLMNTRSISYAGCLTQLFFFLFLVGADYFLLTAMAYDRYVAICQPLHYERLMNKGACVRITASVWAFGFLNSALHTGNMLAICFCGGNMMDQFFCELPQLLKLSCSDSHLNETGVLFFSVGVLLICFVLIILSYIHIIIMVVRIPSEQGRHKAFSTCLPHVTVVSLLVITGSFAYLKSNSSSTPRLNLVVSVFYSILPPVMNPIIYSMRNKEIKASLREMRVWRFFTKN